MFVGARTKDVKIGSRPYIPRDIAREIDRQRTDRKISNKDSFLHPLLSLVHSDNCARPVHLRMQVIRQTITGRNFPADASSSPANAVDKPPHSSKREYGQISSSELARKFNGRILENYSECLTSSYRGSGSRQSDSFG